MFRNPAKVKSLIMQCLPRPTDENVTIKREGTGAAVLISHAFAEHLKNGGAAIKVVSQDVPLVWMQLPLKKILLKIISHGRQGRLGIPRAEDKYLLGMGYRDDVTEEVGTGKSQAFKNNFANSSFQALVL